MNIFIYYVLPNVVLFGSIYLVMKFVDNVTEDFINNYKQYQKNLIEFRQKFKKGKSS